MAAAPPSVWQQSLAAAAAAAGGGGGDASVPAVAGVAPADTDEKLSTTWSHIVAVAGSEAKALDLLELLNGARREDTYQFPVPGWPSLLRAVSPTSPELPPMVQEKYRTCQTMCFCGVFPEIRRAWASVDNSLFLWRYDRSGDVPVEYSGEEQAICCVGLAKPKPNVFLSAIQHVLVLATPVEIVLLGVCISASPAGGDAYEQLSLQPMPLYSLPSDNVIMTCVASSAAGRIFMGGSDGNVYEIQYEATDTWRRRRCTKHLVTRGMAQLLPSFLPNLLFGPPVPLERLVLDDERGILYSLAANNTLQVFDIGARGDEPVHKVAELPDYLQEVTRLSGARQQVFGAGDDKRSTAIKYLAVVPMAESWKIHLVAVTCNGRRAYFTTFPVLRSGPGEERDTFKVPQRYDPHFTRPTTLVAVEARGPLPQAPAAGVRTATDPNSRVMDVTAALYSHGTLLLAESSGPDAKATKLLLAARNYTLPPPSVNVNTASQSIWLREVVSDLSQLVPGETTAIGCLPQPSQLGPDVHPGGRWGAMQNELVSQIFTGPPQVVLVSTAGVLELERRRPVDVLQELLQERSAEKLKQFFEAYGPAEAAAMCYLLATSDKQSMSLVLEAAAALENPSLVGQPALQEDIAGGPDAIQNVRAPDGGMYMGSPVNPNPEPQWSGAHRGLALYVSRLLAPVWDVRLITPSANNATVWKARLTEQTMVVLEHKLRSLDAFLLDAADRRRARGFKAADGQMMMMLGGGAGAGVGAFGGSAAAAGGGMGAGGVGAGGGPTAGGGLFGGSGGVFEDGSGRLNAGGGAGLSGAAGGGVGGGMGGGGGFGGGGVFGMVGGIRGPMGHQAAGAPAAKRQRLWSAALYEEQRNNAIRLLASKAAQALFLLRTLTAANVNRLVLRLAEPTRKALRELTFRDLVEGTLSTELVTAYLSDQLEGSSSAAGGGGGGDVAGGAFAHATSSVSELAAVLQRHAPAFFRDQDRQFFQATAKLSAAEGSGSAAERDALVAEALAGLLAVPQCVNLAEFVPRLAFLRQYKGVVDLVVKVAQLADPHSLAARQGGGGGANTAAATATAAATTTTTSSDITAARAARRHAYQHLLQVLSPLVTGTPTLAAPVGAAAAAAAADGGSRATGTALTPAETKAAKEAVIQAILSSKDEYLITVLYSSLVALGADADLLAHHGPGLEMYLLREGGMSGQAGFGAGGRAWLSDQPIGPLTPNQVRHLQLLARLQAQKRRFSVAAGVYNTLATRLSGPGDSGVTLEERLQAFQDALMQASSSGEKAVVEQLRASVDLMQLQLSIAQRIAGLSSSAAGQQQQQQQQQQQRGGGGLPDAITPARMASDVRALRSRCMDIDMLYNTYAQPYEQWDSCLRLCNVANTVPGEYVRQLWDLLLKQAWEGALGADGRSDGADVRLELCCERTQELGAQFYPNDNSFPLLHVTLRLEAIAAGLWPQPHSEPASDSTRVVMCLRGCISTTAEDSTSGVVAGVYEQLLARRGPLLEDAVAGAGVVLGGSGDGASRNVLRLRLLASLAAHCRIVLREELAPGLVGQSDMGGGGYHPGPFLGRANQAAALADLAERCGSEARALATSASGALAGPAGNLADEFDRLVAELAQQ